MGPAVAHDAFSDQDAEKEANTMHTTGRHPTMCWRQPPQRRRRRPSQRAGQGPRWHQRGSRRQRPTVHPQQDPRDRSKPRHSRKRHLREPARRGRSKRQPLRLRPPARARVPSSRNLARHTGQKESDDAFWIIMDWTEKGNKNQQEKATNQGTRSNSVEDPSEDGTRTEQGPNRQHRPHA